MKEVVCSVSSRFNVLRLLFINAGLKPYGGGGGG